MKLKFPFEVPTGQSQTEPGPFFLLLFPHHFSVFYSKFEKLCISFEKLLQSALHSTISVFNSLARAICNSPCNVPSLAPFKGLASAETLFRISAAPFSFLRTFVACTRTVSVVSVGKVRLIIIVTEPRVGSFVR